MERPKPCTCSHTKRYKTYLEIVNARVNNDVKCFYYHLDEIKDTKLRESTFANEVENLRKIFTPSIQRATLAKENSNSITYPRIKFNYIEEIGIIEQLRGEARRFTNKEKFVKDFHSPDCVYLEDYKLRGTKYLYPCINWFEIVYPFFIRLSTEYDKKHKTDINWKVYKLENEKIGKLYTLLDRYNWIEINRRDFKLLFNGESKNKVIELKWKGTPTALLNLMYLLKRLYFPSESYENVYRFINTFTTTILSNNIKAGSISANDKKKIESIEKTLKS